MYETWCNLMANFWKIKQILHQSLTKKCTDMEESLHFVVQGALGSMRKNVKNHIVTPTVCSEIRQKHQNSLN